MTSIDRLSGISDGLGRKAPVRVVSTSNITLSGLQTIDGVALAENDRVLVAGQTDTTRNGIYNAASSTWTRAKDFDGVRDAIAGTAVIAAEGSNARTEYVLTTTGTITFGTSDIEFETVQRSPMVVQTITSAGPVTVSAGADVVRVNQTVGASITLNLPAAASKTNPVLIADWKFDAGTNNITIVPNGSEKIQNQSSWVIAGNGGSVFLRPISGVGYVL